MAYVYRHIRLDKNVPFYIGIGSDEDGKYLRSLSKKKRNIHWHRIVNKVGYEIDILMDGITWDLACEKEKEFIRLYGRCSTNTGCLVNMTDGGGGSVGLIIPQSVIEDDIKRKSIRISSAACHKIPSAGGYLWEYV